MPGRMRTSASAGAGIEKGQSSRVQAHWLAFPDRRTYPRRDALLMSRRISVSLWILLHHPCHKAAAGVVRREVIRETD